MVDFEIIEIEKQENDNIIIGQSHFIKTVEDVHEALVTAVPNIKFGFAFCEASGPRLVRFCGTDEKLINTAVKNAQKIAAGHSFVLILSNAFPINILKKLRELDEIVGIYAASSNRMQVIVAKTSYGRAIVGVVDGQPPLDVEKEKDIRERKDFLRKIGYKL